MALVGDGSMGGDGRFQEGGRIGGISFYKVEHIFLDKFIVTKLVLLIELMFC